MSIQNNGGSAFPVQGKTIRNGDKELTFNGEAGMSLRDYFIAHAPKHPQQWFKPVMKIQEPAYFLNSIDNYVPIKWWQVWRLLESDDRYSQVNPDWYQWKRELERQTFIQWPIAWADATLAAREVQS
jgi:hypothetical protein